MNGQPAGAAITGVDGAWSAPLDLPAGQYTVQVQTVDNVGSVVGVSQPVAGTLGGIYRYYAGLADSFPFVEEHTPTGGGNVGLLVREPVGVVGAIIPWNGPALLIAYKCAPALLAGCTIVIKASPEAPGSASFARVL